MKDYIREAKKAKKNPQILAEATAEWLTAGRKNEKEFHRTREKSEFRLLLGMQKLAGGFGTVLGFKTAKE